MTKRQSRVRAAQDAVAHKPLYQTVGEHPFQIRSAVPLIDVNAAPGTLHVDALVGRITLSPSWTLAPSQALRFAVEYLGRMTLAWQQALANSNAEIERGEAVFGVLKEIVRISRLGALDNVEAAARQTGRARIDVLAEKMDDEERVADIVHDAQVDAAVAIEAAVSAVRHAGAVAASALAQYPLPARAKPAPNAERPLEVAFVEIGVDHVWPLLTGDAPPLAREGTFIDFLVAAWRDLGFPERDDDIADALGRRVARLKK